MPLYDYQCQKCQTVFEVRATFKEKQDGLKPECPQCQSKKTRQILTSGLFLVHTHDGSSGACGPGAGPGCCGGEIPFSSLGHCADGPLGILKGILANVSLAPAMDQAL